MKKKFRNLSCYEVQHSIKQYLLDEMTIEEAEGFVKHIRFCDVCRKELEEYYAFSSALMQLDSMEEAEKGNFFMNIEKRLERTEASVARQKADHRNRRFAYVFLALLFAAVMGVSIGV
ncbi:MAG: hypothetical protein J6J42_10975 [Lachnospiraceae bacterium]|nr:hypothetical protein [Lachnospiraceae bacterium]MBP3610842.1 hypothetical protein [Lachnospiraceae bacterium]